VLLGGTENAKVSEKYSVDCLMNQVCWKQID
jgi:hypothetical protein